MRRPDLQAAAEQGADAIFCVTVIARPEARRIADANLQSRTIQAYG